MARRIVRFVLLLPTLSSGLLSGGAAWQTLRPTLRFGKQGDLSNENAGKSTLVTLCREAPKNGVGAPEETQQAVGAAAAFLGRSCPPKPARRELRGIYDLLYCTAPGGSSGKVGPFVGHVTQNFLDETRFINAVELFDIIKISLFAEREVMDDTKIRVKFKQTGVEIFGVELFRKDVTGSGVWRQVYVDEDLRVMETPSLFVLQKRTS